MTQQHLVTQSATANPAWSYENESVPTLFAPWTTHVIEAAAPAAGDRVLDVGCGTGIVARRIARTVGAKGRVVGIDLNPNMIAVAREVGEREGLTIEWHQGRAEELPFPDGSFDVVTGQFVLMFLPDRNAGLREMRRVLAEGGRLALSVWQGIDRHPFLETMHLILQRHTGIGALKQPLSLGDKDELHELLTKSGLRHVAIQSASKTHRFPDPERFLANTINTATAALPEMQRLDAEERGRILSAIKADMSGPLERATENGQIVLEWHAHLVRAER